MGIAASLFFSTSDPENSLDWRIRPTDEQYDSQKARWNAVADYLIDELETRSGHAIGSWLQGSYKFGTQVRPASTGEEFDIDLGIYFQWEGEPTEGDYSPATLKGFVQESLEDFAEKSDNDAEGVSEPRERCNRVHFAGDFHIDVPSYHLAPSKDTRSLATEKDKWEESDPKALYEWWKDTISDDVRPFCRRLIRYLKAWAALKFDESERPSSILLTVVGAQAFLESDFENSSGDDEAFRILVKAILARLKKSTVVLNPVNDGENLNRLSPEKNAKLISQMEVLVSIADRALAAPTKAVSADIWSDAFDHFFPIPDAEDQEVQKQLKENRALATISFDPLVSVTARGKSGGRTYADMNKIGPIPKGCEITFTLANPQQLPNGAVVRWMVRNVGKEAEVENDLGHRVGEGISVSRDSAYKGDHYMDVSVRLNGSLIGSRRVPVTVSALEIAPRNPPRPSWVKFRRKN